MITTRTVGDKSEVGIDGTIMDRTDHGQAVINSISVDKWEAGADAVKKAGGQVLQEKTPVPGQGYFAYWLLLEAGSKGSVSSKT